MGLLEPVDDAFPPIVVLVEDYEGRERTFTGGQTEWNLLKVDESLDSVLVVGVADVRETVVGPSSVDCGEGERESGEGGRANGEDDWRIGVRNVGQHADGNDKGTDRR